MNVIVSIARFNTIKYKTANNGKIIINRVTQAGCGKLPIRNNPFCWIIDIRISCHSRFLSPSGVFCLILSLAQSLSEKLSYKVPLYKPYKFYRLY